MTTYQIIYSYTDECGNEVRDIRETYEGSWEGLQGIIKQMRKDGCYDIHADAVDDYEEEPEEPKEESGMNWENWENWTLNHLTDIPKIGKRERGASVFYEYKMTQDDNDRAITYGDVQEYIVCEITESLVDMFRECNPQYEDENPREDVVESICGAVSELIGAGTLYAVDAQTVNAVSEYRAEDGETYCVIKDGKGYGAIKKTDIVDGIVVTAYTGIDACAADTPEEVLKILRGRIKVTAWKAEGLSFEEIARRTKAFYESGE